MADNGAGAAEAAPQRLWAVRPAALDWHRLPSTRDPSSSSRLSHLPIARPSYRFVLRREKLRPTSKNVLRGQDMYLHDCYRLMAWSNDNVLAFASPIPIYIGRAASRFVTSVLLRFPSQCIIFFTFYRLLQTLFLEHFGRRLLNPFCFTDVMKRFQ